MNAHRVKPLLLFLVVLLGTAGVVLKGSTVGAEEVVAYLRSFDEMAWLVFILCYAIATVLFFPGLIMTLAGGILFGPVMGVVCNLSGATLGAVCAFLLARYTASDWVEKKTSGFLQKIKQGIESEGWWFVAFTRLVPIFPFNLLNYALGLTRIPVAHYTAASALFMLPGAIAYTYLGYVGWQAVDGASSSGWVQQGLIALSLLAVVAMLPRFIKHFKAGQGTINVLELKQRLAHQTQALVLIDVRSAEEFCGELGHISEAQNFPMETLMDNSATIQAYQKHAIAIICTTDKRSAKVASILRKQDFSQVSVVSGGMKQWHKQGFEVV